MGKIMFIDCSESDGVDKLFENMWKRSEDPEEFRHMLLGDWIRTEVVDGEIKRHFIPAESTIKEPGGFFENFKIWQKILRS